MAHAERFRLATDTHRAREAAERLFAEVKHELGRFLPPSADVLHVGATAIRGCLTKDDLDVAVRIARAEFAEVEARLAARFPRNIDSVHTDDFAAFEDESRTPHLGIQLTAHGGALDVFHRFTAALRADSDLVRLYNTLKRAHDGRSMEQYRAAKDAFVTHVLQSAPTRSDDGPR